MSKLKITILVVIVAALAGAGIYFLKYGNRAGPGASGETAPALDIFGNPISPSGGSAGAGAGAPPAGGAPASSASQNGAQGAGELSKTYSRENPKFSFRHPESFSVTAFGDDNGETVLVRGRSDKENFQIYITLFDEPFDSAQGKPGPITPERIKQDIPDMVVEQAKELEIAGVKMLAFLSGDAQNRTREVWFSREGYLYQITAYPEFDGGLSEILLSWEFW